MSVLDLSFHKECPDGDRTRIAADFSRSVIEKMCALSEGYARTYSSDHPLIQYERGIYSNLAAAVNGVTNAHMSEIPTTRLSKINKKQLSNGRIDLWAYHRNTDFLIELKQCYTSTNPHGGRLRLQDAWKDICNQTQDVKKSVKDNYGSAVSLGLLIVAPYKSSTKRPPASDWSLDHTQELVGTLLARVKKNRSFHAVWSPPAFMQRIEYEWKDHTEFQFYPAIVFLGRWMVHKSH